MPGTLTDAMPTARMRGFWVGVTALALISSCGASRAQELQAGLWKVVTKPEINGVAGPDQETMRCLTPEDVNNIEVTFSPNSRTTNSTCETTEHEMSLQRLHWRLQCKGQIEMDVAGEFIFAAPEHYTATITTRASMLGKQIQRSRALIEAQRVGACQ
jgi:Protein of unknown function (DUF3617)